MMIDPEILEKLQNASIEERIAVIEMLVQSLKGDVESDTTSSKVATHLQRPAFGFMRNTGKILGDVVAPILPEDNWEALRFIQHFSPGQGDYTEERRGWLERTSLTDILTSMKQRQVEDVGQYDEVIE